MASITRAYCYSSGLIEFGERLPEGTLPIAAGPEAAVRDFISGVARHGYETTFVAGRRQKVPGSDHLLVPGVPEASGEVAKLQALSAFLKTFSAKSLPKSVTTLGAPSTGRKKRRVRGAA